MQVVKPKRLPSADKIFGVQQTGTSSDNEGPRTFIDYLGRLVWLKPRFFYSGPDPFNLTPTYLPFPSRISKGRVLVEPAKTNYVYFNEAFNFNQSYWVKTNITVLVNQDIGPLHGINVQPLMARIRPTTQNVFHEFAPSGVGSLPVGVATISYFVKRYGTGVGSRYVSLNASSGSVGFDLESGQKVAVTGSADGNIEPLANGCFRISMKYTHASGGAAPTLSLRSTAGAGSQAFAGIDLSSGIFLGFPQLESGDLTSFFPSRWDSQGNPAPGTRTADATDFSYSVLASSEACSITSLMNEWRPDILYSAQDVVSKNGIDYQSVSDNNYGKDPLLNPTFWIRKSVSNTWAMFDEFLSSNTKAVGGLEVAILLGGASRIVFMGLINVDEVRVMLSGGPGQAVTWQQSVTCTGQMQVVFDLPESSFLAEIRFVNNAGESIEVGNVIWGTPKTLGSVRYGARAGIRDYSRKETDEFGETVLVQRSFAKTLACTLEVDKTELSQVQSTLEELRATPALWIGSTDADFSQSLVVYGFYKDFYISIDYPTMALCSLEIEGLI